MPGQFDMQQNFPIASVADLIAQRPFKEQQMRAQQQGQLVEGLKQFGQGVDSLVSRRNAMAQALAQAQVYGQTPEGQQALGTSQVTTTPQGPVTRNQTAAFDPATGSVTPNQSPVTQQTLAATMYGLAPKDFLANQATTQGNRIQQGELALRQQTEPQKIAIEGKKALAEQQNNQILREIQAKMANATMANNKAERAQAEENAARESNKAILASGSPLNPFNPVTFAQKKAAIQGLSGGSKSGWKYVGKVEKK